jgi:hypothetical protein
MISVQTFRFFPRSWGFLVMLAPIGIAVGGMAAMFAFAVVRCRGPIVRRAADAPARSEAERRLEPLLPRFVGRQDRRLVAHIVERLAQIRAAGHAVTTEVLAARAADGAEALAALDARRDADASVDADPARALEELRREEQTRAVLRADLLRAASWLDRLGQGLARAAAVDAAEAGKQIEGEIEQMNLAIAAEDELATLLGGGR